MEYSTLEFNAADRGGGVFNYDGDNYGVVMLGDDILANTGSGNTDFGSFSAFPATLVDQQSGNNLIENSQIAALGPVPNAPTASYQLITGVDPKLGPLQANGGPTLTMAPLPGSPVINAGSAPFESIPTDQRGMTRDYVLPGYPSPGDGSDLGAVEIHPATLTVNTTDGSSTSGAALSLAAAVALADGTLAFGSLTAAQQAQVSGDPAFDPTIQFAENLDGQEINLTTATDTEQGPTALLITTDVVIVGPSGSQGVTIAGPGSGGNLRLFRVQDGASLTLENLTLSGGAIVGYMGGNSALAGGGGGGAAGVGGAILNEGTLVIADSTLSGNTARGGAGGSSSTTGSNGGGGGGGAGTQNNGASATAQAGGPGGGPGSASGGASAVQPNGSPSYAIGGGGGGGYGSNYFPTGGRGGAGNAFGGGGGGGIGESGGTGGAGGLGGGGGAAHFEGPDFSAGAGGPGGALAGAGASGGTYGPTYTPGGGGGGGAGLGGAVFNDQGAVTISNSTLYDNNAYGGSGGGTGAGAGQGAGGAVFNDLGTVTISNSTLSGDQATRGGAVFDFESTKIALGGVTVNASILANTTGTADDFDTNIAGLSFSDTRGSSNLIPKNNGFEGGVVSTANPLLAPLGKYGGPTPTLPVLPGSPAINAYTTGATPGTDQRGITRPASALADLGAFQSQGFTIAITGGTDQVAALNSAFTSALDVTVSSAFGEPVQGGVVTFTPPASGASATLSSKTATIGTTGVAAVTASANNIAGVDYVTASASGATPSSVVFNLLNDAPPTPAIVGLPTSSPKGTAITLTASATDSSATLTAAGFSDLWQATDSQGISSTTSQALSFNGTNQFVDLGNPTDLSFSGQTATSSAPITLEAWIKPQSTTGYQDIIAHGYQLSPSYAEDFLRINNGYYQVGSWNGNTAMAQAPIPAGDVGQWDFLAGVYDGTEWLIYVNGELAGTSGPTTQGALPVSMTNWAIGAEGGGTGRLFQGEIDDVSIWNVGRAAASVRSEMSASVSATESGLLADYPFDETSGTTVVDATANHNNGTLGGSNAANAPARVPGIVLGQSATITPKNAGTETVTLVAFDEYGGTGVSTAAFMATEVPLVNLGSNATIPQSTALTRAGSFTDAPGDGPWTATVRYGDGTGAQPLTLNANHTFTLSHAYASAGTYTPTVSVTNQDGLTGTASFSLTVTGPLVSAGGSATVQQGATFTRNGSFTDVSGSGPWTATVRYGDGTGAHPLALNANQTFTISHVVPNAGTFGITVTVTDAAGNIGMAGFYVTVSGFTVNDGSPQDSMVRSLTYTFPSPTAVEPGAFELLRDGKPSKIKLNIAPQSDGMTYLITFSGPGVIGGSVPDGKYTLVTLYKKIHVLSGPPMTANDVNTFNRLFGDVNGDGVVNSLDKAYLLEAEANPASPYAPDFEYDGKPMIDKTDIAQFDKRYKGPADPPRKAPARFPGRRVVHQVASHHAAVTAHPAGT